MIQKYLAVDDNIIRANEEARVWSERDIAIERVDDMTQAINKLRHDSDYYFIGINSDSVDYLPLLKTLRSVTNAPIFIGTSNYTTEEQVKAINNGADEYMFWHENNEKNVASISSYVTRIFERKSEPFNPCQVFIHNELLIAPAQRSVFVKNTKVVLTRQEYDLLYYLIMNRGMVLNYEQLYSKVWNNGASGDAIVETIKSAIKRLRKRLCETSNYIESVRGIGYKFSI